MDDCQFQGFVRLNDYETGFGDASQDVQNFSTFNIDMDIERDAWGLFTKIFIGMYIAFLIAIISFTPHPSELEPRFGLPSVVFLPLSAINISSTPSTGVVIVYPR